ncbi:lysM domain receptor-like kinase 3 isoform X2 [Camellia sinensis]|uniref:lysM domain receptor-like kinase 3 isoform X2 n=1 Tax=Camellia sinensis TaxID=4442 RepID=UPI00103655F2|nr:lysM domain receptor-like kinase 3 isoform X2 [Camellia sinensis]
MNLTGKSFWVSLFFLLQSHLLCFSYPTPLNCSDTTRLCTSFLAFKPNSNETLAVIQSMFDVLPEDLTFEGNGRDYVFIRKNCSCFRSIKKYLTNTTYTVRENSGSVYDVVVEAYDGLAFFPNNMKAARARAVVPLRLFCGCSSGLWNYLMSYVMKDGDSIDSLASRFGVSMGSIETLNGIDNPDNVSVGALYYVPLNSVPGETYPTKNDIPPAPVPVPSVAGCFSETEGSGEKNLDGKISHKFHNLRNTSFCCASGRYICCKSGDWKRTSGESSDHQKNISKAIGADLFDVEKPVVFSYEEILSSTDGFSDSNLLGHGTYGSVYYGLLCDQEVAIKRMTATKTKEFRAEIKVLCKVHHTNLVELIGYATSEDDLFLIYEYAQKGSVGSHLHDPQSKGHTSLSWIMRLQIVLDAARGLEYIHEHTKPHYVHRDIKTSNILLDGAFRAKISDFGLAKLVGKTTDGEASVTRVVGTYGYLAPEYLQRGLATMKSDVYAFGVVLFEIISGKEAVIRTKGIAMENPERRSLVSIMLAALKNSPDSMTMSSMKDHIDPNLMELYPQDSVFKVAMLAKQCVDEDPILRPDMKQVTISLSQILLSSVEWEATLAGNSQIFSDLVKGR